MLLVLAVVALILAVIIVNFLENLIMRITNYDVMITSMKVKLVCYFVVWTLITSFLAKTFGVEI